VSEELVEKAHDHRMVGELLQWPRDVIALVLRQRFRLVAHAQDVTAHLLGFLGEEHTGYEQPPTGVEEMFLLLGKLDYRIAAGRDGGQILGPEIELVTEVLVDYEGFTIHRFTL